MLQKDGQTLACSLYCKFAGTIHLIKGKTCTRPQCFGNFEHDSKRKHLLFPSNTHLSHREAPRCCQLPKCDPFPEPSCLARKLGLSGWYPGGWPRGLSSLTPKTAPLMAPSNPHQHCTLKAQRTMMFVHELHFSSGISGHTQNVDPFLHNPRRRL